VLIATQHDALVALNQLGLDVNAAAQNALTIGKMPVPLGSIFGLGGLGATSPGADDTQQAALSLLTTIAQYILSVDATLTDDDTPLTDVQTQQMQELQREVLDARSTIGSTISDLNWTFGDLVNDTITSVQNLAGQAVGAVSDAFGVNWTYVKIGAAVVGVVVLIAVYRSVRA
jgi:hypothetical protein